MAFPQRLFNRPANLPANLALKEAVRNRYYGGANRGEEKTGPFDRIKREREEKTDPLERIKRELKVFGVFRVAGKYGLNAIPGMFLLRPFLSEPPSLEATNWKTRYALSEYAQRRPPEFSERKFLNALQVQRREPVTLSVEQLNRFRTLAQPRWQLPNRFVEQNVLKSERATSGKPLFRPHEGRAA
ncbi:hypothetical protein COU39_03235 [Candidatus Micrarchaeota archaeon CG10_big_fil_rev_8_21_14_0_10_60_32]|nr:MAG: hypothetical protein AUJ16_00655 [Candidatus Micrarchaeota archaeon CG1_02_60_51]PIN95993.1 MAG: hypothetical protein COU39_03235 [Candidatus Micrarchaeota archaeon CG10_big_fil_rev_8_21_14_0_10_60_32]PIO02377.1 MAG: hypothetical protein COT58_00470 [Candidatus Micrarchaeota archaeon CG09_land_8_20_14_0_10_60_16]PIY91682.1 MAG: hypothetical protein COY71_01880 [Candidatus Micrarchaeota archaeon CG_4_10_14_0_8_um_filter_60_7]